MANIADIKLNERVQWGREQEELLQGLLQTKARFEQQSKEPLVQHVRTKYPWVLTQEKNRGPQSLKLAEWLIAEAGTIRDLLKPFDDGTRPVQDQPGFSGPGFPGR